MSLLFLDSNTIDRGDLDFTSLAGLGELILLQAGESPTPHLALAEVIISNKAPVGPALLDLSPALRLVVSAATGVNQIDLEACRARGIAVANVAGYSTPGVAQHTMALLLELATRTGAYAATVRRDWPASPIFTRLDYPLFDLAGKTLGIVGLGEIGHAVARIALGMEMEVIAYARPGSANTHGIPRLGGDEFFQACDVISLHCPLTAETEHFLNEERLDAMRPGAIVINTGRGGLIDEPALAAALREGRLRGAGLDVLSVEPPPADHPLLAPDLPNLVITPHVAWSTREARIRLLDGIVADILAFRAGKSLNRIV